jgi:hypothetical protein
MTREEVAELRQRAFRRFYSRPRFLLRRLLAIRTAHDVQVAIKGIVGLFWLWARPGLFKRGG